MSAQAHAAALAVGLCGLVACQQPAPPAISLPPELAVCASYANMPNALGYCVVRRAASAPSVEDMVRLCDKAGAWEGECRRSWVAGHSDPSLGYPRATLLEACGVNADCAFELLDAWPQTDVTAQLQDCASYARHYAQDCAVHALQRWVQTRPGPQQVSYVANLNTPWPSQVGYAVGMVAACQGMGTCAGGQAVQTACWDTVRRLQHGRLRCP